MFDIFFGAKGDKTPFRIFMLNPQRCNDCGKKTEVVPAGARVGNGLVYVPCDCGSTVLVPQPIKAAPEPQATPAAC